MATTKQKTSWQVIIPEWENHYILSKKSKPKYWLWKDRDKLPKIHKDKLTGIISVGKKDYCQDKEGNRFIKNSKSVGKPKVWVINGQQLYSGNMYPQTRAKITEYFHKYFSKYILEQLPKDGFQGEKYKNSLFSISCDIYEIKRGQMPDIGNMWPLIKWFEDALQDCNIIPDDNPDYVIESGRKKYHWVEKEEDRKLVFNIETI